MRPYGLRTEIIVNLGVVVAAALAFVALFELKIAERELVQERVARAVDALELAAAGLEYGPAGPSAAGGAILRTLRERLELEDLILVDATLGTVYRLATSDDLAPVLSDLQGSRLSGQSEIRIDYPGGWWFWTTPSAARARITVPLPHGQREGALQGVVPLGDVRARLFASQRPVLLYVSLYGAILILFGGFLIGRNIVAPIRRLAAATRAVASGRLEAHVPPEGLHEVADLADSFNRMTAALADSERRNREHIQSLEGVNRELQVARDDLVRSEKLASAGHLAAGMAHEIGNPLGALIGYLGFLQGELREAAPRELVTRALAEAERIDRLVRDLLDYAAPGNSALEPLDPAALAREALALLRHQEAFGPVPVADRLPPALPAVTGVRHRLVQVFVNLLLNARDACAGGGEILLEGGAEPDTVWLAVADSGSGIPREQLPHLFDPFYTTKAPGKGRGLGLAVCHHIVEETGGRLRVESQPGRGSRFTLQLPRQGERRDG